jgi:nicotinamidase-related amidase
MPQPALLIIDMQMGMTWPSAGVRNNPDAEKNIGVLLSRWRKASAPVMHAHHRSRTIGSPFYPNQPGIEVQSAFVPMDGELVVAKQVPDAFTNTELEHWLRKNGITSVIIAGVSTNNSVEATTRIAGSLGFSAYVVADACFAFAKRDFDGVQRTAQEVHAMSLANLNGEYAMVIPSVKALELLREQAQ